jgi:hypothetical protein
MSPTTDDGGSVDVTADATRRAPRRRWCGRRSHLIGLIRVEEAPLLVVEGKSSAAAGRRRSTGRRFVQVEEMPAIIGYRCDAIRPGASYVQQIN